MLLTLVRAHHALSNLAWLEMNEIWGCYVVNCCLRHFKGELSKNLALLSLLMLHQQWVDFVGSLLYSSFFFLPGGSNFFLSSKDNILVILM